MFLLSDNISFFQFSSSCSTSLVQNTNVGLNYAAKVSKSKKYQGPFIDDYGLDSAFFQKGIFVAGRSP